MALSVITTSFIESDEFLAVKERIQELAGFEGDTLLLKTVERVAETSVTISRETEPPPKGAKPGRPFYARGVGFIGRTTGTPIGGRATSQDLSNSWVVTARGSAGQARAVILNTATYASYVVGKFTQAQQHKGRWSTIEDIVDVVIGEAGQVVPEVNVGQTTLSDRSPLSAAARLEQDLLGNIF